MSAAFKLAKKKVSQHDLRKLMAEQKKVSRGNGVQDLVNKIDSPFAKYDNDQLSCQLCKKKLSHSIWKVHINSKQHKENLAQAKQLKEKLVNHVKPPTIQQRVAALKQEQKAKGTLKGILKNSSSAAYPSTSDPAKPPDGDVKLLSTDSQDNSSNHTKDQDEGGTIRHGDEKMLVDETLPEGFFDDPVKDAKARNLDYKNPIEEEWEKFRKEIKEAEVQSMTIITEEQEESTVERQIDEIDAQIKNWSRVLELEKKKEKIGAKLKCEIMQVVSESPSSSEDEEELPEFLDWRAKKGHK